MTDDDDSLLSPEEEGEDPRTLLPKLVLKLHDDPNTRELTMIKVPNSNTIGIETADADAQMSKLHYVSNLQWSLIETALPPPLWPLALAQLVIEGCKTMEIDIENMLEHIRYMLENQPPGDDIDEVLADLEQEEGN